MPAATPGFYTFLDEDGASCQLREAETGQVEYRIYPDGVTQQVLMDGSMAIATSMRYVQHVVVAVARNRISLRVRP
ncbi:hypothetical protein [Natrinema longum]|uniref:hypothetical protein n=1 Tax=Natrinema longum TaxID=370324 RepID=UPI001CCF48EA|nr:hypothetical protein [Natrinema longum]